VCPLFLTTDPNLARPASPWADCGPGCLELVHDWGDPAHRLFSEIGASQAGERYIGYTRSFGPDLLGPFGYEIQLVRLADNAVVFDALTPGGGGPCHMQIDDVDGTRAVYRLQDHVTEPNTDHRVVFTANHGAELVVLENVVEPGLPLETVLGGATRSFTYSRKTILRQSLGGGEIASVWESDGPYAFGLFAHQDALFFSAQIPTGPSALFETLVWSPSAGAEPLLPAPAASGGGNCCVKTDGSDMVWLAGTGWQAGSDTFSEVMLMHSPYGTSAAGLQPTALRPMLTDKVTGGKSVVGGGYALIYERLKAQPSDEANFVLTRLSDGAHWIVPPRPGFHWGTPLYVDAEELALSETPSAETIQAEGLHTGYVYTIVRLQLASLGPPTMP
jgi:hypothetical protein